MLIVKVWVEVNLIAEYGILGGWCVVELGMIITLMTQCVQQVLLGIVPKSYLLLSTASLNRIGICLLEHFLFIHGRVRWWLHMHCSLLGRMFEVNWLLLLTWVEVARALLKYSFFWLLDRFARHINRSLVLQLQWHGLVFVCLNRWSHIVLLIIALIDRWERPIFTSHIHIYTSVLTVPVASRLLGFKSATGTKVDHWVLSAVLLLVVGRSLTLSTGTELRL